MSNVEHPKHYQLSIDLEVLDIIQIVISNKKMKNEDSFYLGNVIKYLFRAEKKKGLEDYKKAFYYLNKIEDIHNFDNYKVSEQLILDKAILTIKNDKIRDIVYLLLEDVLGATNFLEKYINEMENKQNEI